MVFYSSKKPDNDSIRLFVGRIPRQLKEDEVYKLFRHFGDIYSVIVIRDQKTDLSQGCAFLNFVHYFSCERAINEMNGLFLFKDLNLPLIVKPSNQELKLETKIYVSRIPATMNDNELKKMFGQFGTVLNCIVLRKPNGISSGFVSFPTKKCAYSAIKKMNDSITFEGHALPIIVKIADNNYRKNEETFDSNSIPDQNNESYCSSYSVAKKSSNFASTQSLESGELSFSEQLYPTIYRDRPNQKKILSRLLTAFSIFNSYYSQNYVPEDDKALESIENKENETQNECIFTLLVKNIPKNYNEALLSDSSKIGFQDEEGSRIKCGFVTLARKDEALGAIENLNGHKINDSILSICFTD